VALVRDVDGRPLYIVSQMVDMTERRRVEEELREADARYRTLVDNLSEVVFRVDTGGRVSFVNQAWETLTGYTVAETVGTPSVDYLHPDDRAAAVDNMMALACGTSGPHHGDMRFVTKHGDVRVVRGYLDAVRKEDGTLDGFLGTLADVSHQYELEADQDASATHPRLSRLS
jgi:PAS domain S-box-containing protein